ncbi:hypothetical protein SHKM778_62530 [Streptomyces sp. KM77-8]|uniref:Orotidine 5'-phosphate decarboxylase n=1 Tax=Streptomyces haneummycinicus TaxID=3074435 RepID=A0AAT9HRQ2_9ACTN
MALARETGTGLFVLALTSNPEGGEVQHAVRADGRSVGATMLGHLAAENAGEEPLGSFGAVVGATLGDLSSYELDVGGPILAPGIGAQGATAADLPAVFGGAVRNVVPSVSRGVLRHGPDAVALRDAAERFADGIRTAVTAG